MNKNKFYVYAYLDPRKQGNYLFNEYYFNYEPFYIGKGHGRRKYIHLHNSYNKHLNSKIKKIRKETGYDPFIIVYKELMIESDAFILETDMIQKIGRSDIKKGPLCNHTNGGEGPSGHIKTEKFLQRVRKFSSKIIKQAKELRKEGKAWSDIAKETGISTRQIRHYCKNIIKNPKFSSHIINLARQMRADGKSWNEISKHINVAVSTIRHWCRDIILDHSIIEGKKHLVRQMRADGKSWNEISNNINLSAATIRYWCRDLEPINQQFKNKRNVVNISKENP